MPFLGTIFGWLSGGVLEAIGNSIVMPFIKVWLKSKDVDLEKFKVSAASTTGLAEAVLEANIRHAEIKAQYALSVLQWWPFRLILFILISVAATRFVLASFDSTWWWIFGCTIKGQHVIGDACSWSFPSVLGTFGEAEKEFLLFFIIAKPVDTAVSGGLAAVQKYLRK